MRAWVDWRYLIENHVFRKPHPFLPALIKTVTFDKGLGVKVKIRFASLANRILLRLNMRKATVS
jgi:hypothetical protein